MSLTADHACQSYDIAIVGAGLVGASLAALLALQVDSESRRSKCHRSIAHSAKPQRIVLIDAGDEPKLPSLESCPPEFDARVVALTHASQQLFESLGVWSAIQSQRACAYTHMQVWDNDGTASVRFDAKDIQQPHLGHIVENSILLRAVLDRLQQSSNITVLREVSVSALSSAESTSTLQLSDGSSITANIIVAADGAQSTVRQLASMPIREWDYRHKAIVATVSCEHSHQSTAWQNFLTTGPLAFLPLGDPSTRYCSIVWSIDSDKADVLMDLDDEAFCRELGRAFEHRLGAIETVSRRVCFPLKQRHAINYQQGNIVLVGDAAHTIHPLAGQGVNLGLLDAQALAVEVERAMHRNLAINHPSVLRRYQRRRKAHNLEVMLLMEGFKRLFGSRHLWVRWLRNTGMKTVNELTAVKNWLAKQAIQSHEH